MDTRWIDAEAAGKALGVTGWTIRKWCLDGRVTRWRTLGLGLVKRYQVAEEALAELRGRFIHERSAKKPEKPESAD